MRLLAVGCCALLAAPVASMKENLEIEDDFRSMIAVDTFGFYRNGQITLKMSNLQVSEAPPPSPRFSITHSRTAAFRKRADQLRGADRRGAARCNC